MDDLDELRLKIAKMMGWKRMFGRMDKASRRDHEYFITPSGTLSMYLPDWPGDIAEAWKLMDEMRESGLVIIKAWHPKAWVAGHYTANVIWAKTDDKPQVFEGGATGPEAIARAWLAWKEAEE